MVNEIVAICNLRLNAKNQSLNGSGHRSRLASVVFCCFKIEHVTCFDNDTIKRSVISDRTFPDCFTGFVNLNTCKKRLLIKCESQT